MADRLQQHLKDQALKHSALNLLQNQWEFDRLLIPKALQNIGNLFPHYSRHDHSHSQQILVNIERLLGDSINSLSATDTWLLLEAAYWHDIGMVVPEQAIREALDSTKFAQFLKTIATEPGHELAMFAQHFDPQDLSKAFGGAASPMDAVEKFRYLMAEWFRRQHPGRTKTIVGDPWGQIGLSSPRTELIPARLFNLLGRICQMHGDNFDAIFQLPFRETGMANDDCHPRFIACMLRLGDLLDIDDNRFCPVMQRMAGDNRPASSKAHEHKHASIRHFRLDRERIEITAECTDVDGYVEQWQWLDWLKQEMRSQMARWQDIAPSREFGLLPTLGKIEVHISGKNLILADGKRPQFGLDHDRVMELFKGANLYKREDSIRELLQNAVDATLIRIWAEQKDRGADVDWQNPEDPKVKAILGASTIDAKIEKIDNLPNQDPKTSNWRLTIDDSGTGISRHDLAYMLRVGGSSRNLQRRALIDSMPEWMKPSGTFGIGFQSVFLWAEVLTIQTHSYETKESLKITLHSPTGPKRGLVTIEQEDSKPGNSGGSKIFFEFQEAKKPGGNYKLSMDGGLVHQFFSRFDPLLDSELPIEAGRIAEAVQAFALDAPIRIAGNYSDGSRPIGLGQTRAESETLEYLPETVAYFRPIFQSHRYSALFSELKFRGQEVHDDDRPNLPYLRYTINICSGDAAEWLGFDRNRLKFGVQEKIETLLLQATLEWLECADTIPEGQRGCVSASLHCSDTNDSALLPRLKIQRHRFQEDWKSIQIFPDSESSLDVISLSDLLKVDVKIGCEHDAPRPEQDGSVSINAHKTRFLDDNMLWLCAREWQKNSGRSIEYCLDENDKMVIRLIDGSGATLFDQHIFKRKLEEAVTGNFSKRCVIPLSIKSPLEDFRCLVLKSNTSASVGNLFPLAEGLPYLLLPYFFPRDGFNFTQKSSSIDTPRLKDLAAWTHSRLETPMSLEQIETEYLRLIAFIDDEIMTDSAIWEKARQSAKEVVS